MAEFRSLQEFPFLSRDFLRHFQVVIEETRSWANFEVAEVMHSREQNDWARYGRLRERWEKRYQDPNDVLIEAEKRSGNFVRPLASVGPRTANMSDRWRWLDWVMFCLAASLTLWPDLPAVDLAVVMVALAGAAMAALGSDE